MFFATLIQEGSKQQGIRARSMPGGASGILADSRGKRAMHATSHPKPISLPPVAIPAIPAPILLLPLRLLPLSMLVQTLPLVPLIHQC